MLLTTTIWSIRLCYITILSQYRVFSTIDVNANELEYLAARLNPFECRRLIAALHYTTYELPNNLAEAERNVDDDIPCIRHLIHWNSSPSEGKGKTHEALTHRLRQINRDDLADWLGKSTFTQLGKDLSRVVEKSFDELAKEESEPSSPITLAPKSHVDEDPWHGRVISAGGHKIHYYYFMHIATRNMEREAQKKQYPYRFLCRRSLKLNMEEMDGKTQTKLEEKRKIVYSTESSDENTDYAQLNSEAETNSRN
ncbi:uncharacterized protein LOC117223772 [Megalopta genalis]|uniref:uncharacterized protein LOC117223772 n=1 Tax=Megalopta genalis TaxID=115081 RepID=UPI003FD3A03E